MRVTIQSLRAKTNKAGRSSYYWEPSATLRKAGWKPVALGTNESAAMAQARAINVQVQAWKDGGKGPQGVRVRPPADTLAHLIERYRRERIEGKQATGRPWLAPATIGQYNPSLARLGAWAGAKPLAWVTPGKVASLRDRMIGPEAKGGIGHHAAFATLKMGRTLFAFAIESDIIEQGKNPFEKFGLGAPDPRQVLWSTPAREAVPRAARALGHVSIALAIELGFATGQRPADFRELLVSRYMEIKRHELHAADYATFASLAPDGVPRGLLVHQLKGDGWVKVPVFDELREAVEANVARAKAIGATTILIDDTRLGGGTDPTYSGSAGEGRFGRDFSASRALAVATARAEGDHELAMEIAGLTFRDLRRTCVVYLGEHGLTAEYISGVSGHNLATTTAILKTYMPRTTARAGAAIATLAVRKAEDAARQSAKESNR